MGELYCCSNESNSNIYDESNNKLITKSDFSKKYIIGKGGFSKVSLINRNILYIDMESSI